MVNLLTNTWLCLTPEEGGLLGLAEMVGSAKLPQCYQFLSSDLSTYLRRQDWYAIDWQDQNGS